MTISDQDPQHAIEPVSDAAQDEAPRSPAERVEHWVNQAYRGGLVSVVVLSFVYAFFPVDVIPDLLLVVGQMDDLAVLLAGGGTAATMTALRPLLITIFRHPMLRAGCLMLGIGSVFVLLAGAVLLFYGIYSLIQAL